MDDQIDHSDDIAPADVAEIRRIAVLGAGLMGHAIAYVFASHGRSVTIFDSAEQALGSLPKRLALLAADVGGQTVEVNATSDMAQAVTGADLIIEAVPEDLDLKAEVLAAVHELAPKAILTTNTSVIQIAAIAGRLPAGAQLVGTHWWNPPHQIKIVEVVPAPAATTHAIDAVRALLAECGKDPVTVADVPGFVGNRLQFALWREAMHIVEQGYCDAETVDQIARETFGRRLRALGPLENADYIGLPLTAQIMSYVLPGLAVNQTPPAALTRHIDSGERGAVSGRGFMTWDPERRTRVRQRLAAALRSDTHQENYND